jgi:hypothetical protein
MTQRLEHDLVKGGLSLLVAASEAHQLAVQFHRVVAGLAVIANLLAVERAGGLVDPI